MTIAYDLRYASDHFPGIGTHAYCLAEALLALPGEERYLLLWNPALRNTRFDLEPLRRHPRVRWIELDAPAIGWRAPAAVGRTLRGLAPRVYFSPFGVMPSGAGCPCVLTLHDVLPLRGGHFPWWSRLLFRAALARAAAARCVITSSEFSRAEIAAVGGPAATRVRVVRPGVPPSLVREARRPAALPDEPFSLVVGINKPHKNLVTLAEAWRRLGPAAPLRLVAAGPEDARYPRLAPAGAGAGRVTALGRVSGEELEWLYRNATLVVFPTLYEGFGFPLVEAFSHGCPAIASDIPSLREIGEGAARFVAPRDPEAWAAAVRELAADGAAREALACAGRARAAALTYARTAAGVLEVLREAAA